MASYAHPGVPAVLQAAEDAHHPAMAAAPAPLAVFLVEDNALIRENLIVALEELADMHVVAWATTEGEAATWLRSQPDGWELAVIDLFLRAGSGLGVLRACRQRGKRQRAVVLTNYANVDIRAQCMALGADAVFDKSTELDAFLAFCSAPQAPGPGPSSRGIGDAPGPGVR